MTHCVEVLSDQAAVGVDLVGQSLTQVQNMLEGADCLQMGYHATVTLTERCGKFSFHTPHNNLHSC